MRSASCLPLVLQERKDFDAYDPRWTAALDMVKSGAFGRPDYFDDLVASVNDMNRGNDWFLLGARRWGLATATHRGSIGWDGRADAHSCWQGF